MIEVERIDSAGFCWRVNRRYLVDVEGLVRDPAGCLDAAAKRVVKSNNVRTVYFLRLGGGDCYVKQYHAGGRLEQWKTRLGESKAAREWRIMKAGREAGLPVPVPVVMGERWRGGRMDASYLASVSIDDARDLTEFVTTTHLWEDSAARRAFLRDVGRAVRALHDAGLLHRDLHCGNILVRVEETGRPAIHFIDLHRGSLRSRLGPRARRRNVGLLLHSLSGFIGRAERAEVLEGYGEAGGAGLGPPAAVERGIEARIRRLERRRLRSRTRRCVVRSSQFDVIAGGEGTLFVDREFGAEAAKAALESYRRGGGEVRQLKRTARTRVARVEGGDRGPVIVKHYEKRALEPLIGGRGRAAWKAAHGLRVRGFPGVRPLAFLARRGGGGWMVMATAAGARLDHHVIALARAHGVRSRAFGVAVRRLGDAVADLVRALHHAGVYHGDLKACNLFVDEGAEGAIELTLVDVDRVRFGRGPLDERRRIKNLAQLHAAVTTHVSRSMRGRWFRRYATDEEYRDRRRFYTGIARECASKIVVDREPIE